MSKRIILKGKKATFFLGLRHHLLKLFPVAEYLKQQGMRVSFLTGRNMLSLGECFEIYLKQKGISYRHLYEYRDKNWGSLLKGRLDKLTTTVLKKLKQEKFQSFSYINPVDLCYTLEDFLECRELFERMILEEKPDILLGLHEANFWVKLMAQIAHNYDIPVLTFQEGFYSETEVRGEKYSVMAELSTVALWGEEAKKAILNRDPKAEKNIFIVGSPEYDVFFRNRTQDYKLRKEAKRRLAVSEKEKVVLLILPNPYERFKDSIPIKDIVKAISSMKDVTLFIKWHPRESIETMRKYQKIYNSRKVKNIISGDIKKILHGCDLCLVLDSSAGLDVLIYKRPLLEINIGNISYGRSYAKNKVALLVDTTEKLSLIRYVLNGRKKTYTERDRKIYLEKIFYKLDGRSCERIAGIVYRLVSNNRREKVRISEN